MDFQFIELKQKHVDAFCLALPKDIPVNIVFYDLTRYASAVARAAISAKWLDFPDDIAECNPGTVMSIAKQATKAYYASLVISPE